MRDEALRVAEEAEHVGEPTRHLGDIVQQVEFTQSGTQLRQRGVVLRVACPTEGPGRQEVGHHVAPAARAQQAVPCRHEPLPALPPGPRRPLLAAVRVPRPCQRHRFANQPHQCHATARRLVLVSQRRQLLVQRRVAAVAAIDVYLDHFARPPERFRRLRCQLVCQVAVTIGHLPLIAHHAHATFGKRRQGRHDRAAAALRNVQVN
mmetsp:Transcript_17565/g.44594  ORF Transcript_17565/g.44594 Transcript_17565/m.44594 type:complete len:206 (+) Transcript_17565:158-775(+)